MSGYSPAISTGGADREAPLKPTGARTDKKKNYQPIALLSCLSKAFETILNRKIHKHLYASNLLSDRQVAVLGGSGSFGIERAIAAGADVYVTADLKYHDLFKAEKKILLVDIGHYESEQFTKNLLTDYLTKKITNFAPAVPESGIILSKISTNPINYT